jgi:hypothetical protein
VAKDDSTALVRMTTEDLLVLWATADDREKERMSRRLMPDGDAGMVTAVEILGIKNCQVFAHKMFLWCMDHPDSKTAAVLLTKILGDKKVISGKMEHGYDEDTRKVMKEIAQMSESEKKKLIGETARDIADGRLPIFNAQDAEFTEVK